MRVRSPPVWDHDPETAHLGRPQQYPGRLTELNLFYVFRLDDHMIRMIRQSLDRQQLRLQAGQTFLASVGSLAPCIGLFGTVWGIHNALIGLSILESVAISTRFSHRHGCGTSAPSLRARVRNAPLDSQGGTAGFPGTKHDIRWVICPSGQRLVGVKCGFGSAADRLPPLESLATRYIENPEAVMGRFAPNTVGVLA